MTVQQLAPGTKIEIVHIISDSDGNSRWGWDDECSSKWHNHGREHRYVKVHYPGVQVQHTKYPDGKYPGTDSYARVGAVEDRPDMYRVVDTAIDTRLKG